MDGGMKHLLCFGFGFSARTLTAKLDRNEWRVSATTRGHDALAADVTSIRFGDALPADVTHVVISAPPGENGDPVIASYGDWLKRQTGIVWTGYLSTTGVYGDRQGEWVDEESPLTPSTQRGEKRLAAERAWLALHAQNPLGLQLFRLAGIYGPGRNQLLSLIDGTAKRVVKAGQVFSRIHVEDIAGVLLASMARPDPTRAYNVCDDEPCPPQEVVTYAAGLLGIIPPPEVSFDEAELSAMAKSFYAESKRVANGRIKSELGYALIYPTYREGLQALVADIQR